jgi:glycosyltransferase involved in cell wall biosynthesis
MRLEQCQPGAGTLLIAGDGPLRQELEAKVREHSLHSVRFLRHVEYDAIASFYAASDVFVLPTLEDNWALVVPEAMACGLPILCSRFNGGHGDLIDEEKNGWVFDPYDEENFCGKLATCVAQRDRLPEMGRRSLKIIENHGPERAAESIMEGCKIAMEHHFGGKIYKQAGEMIG